MTKTNLSYNSAGDVRPAGTIILAYAYFVRVAARAGALRPDLVFVTFSGNYPHGLNMV
jgi:hypothetical protein